MSFNVKSTLKSLGLASGPTEPWKNRRNSNWQGKMTSIAVVLLIGGAVYLAMQGGVSSPSNASPTVSAKERIVNGNNEIVISTSPNEFCPGSRIGKSMIYMKGECFMNSNLQLESARLTIHDQFGPIDVRVDQVLPSQDPDGVVLHVCTDSTAPPCVETVFNSFCAFGASTTHLMDQSKFQKLFRDLKVFNKGFTTTDADIIFNRVKPKTDRKIDLKMFMDALKLIGPKWAAAGTANPVGALETKICGGQVIGRSRQVSTSKYGGPKQEPDLFMENNFADVDTC